MWHYHGGTDEGLIKHTDLVLLDSKGTHMYGQIPPGTADRLKDVLKEGKVFTIRKFLRNVSRTNFRPVESPFMVQFARYTLVEEKPGMEFPFCTYSLTAFADIPKPSVTPTRFIDVIGKIINVSDIIPVQSQYQTTASSTRTVILTDLLGQEIKLVLWGDRAVEFDADTVRTMGETEPVIAIFVGTLPKMARGLVIICVSCSLEGQFVPLSAYVPTGPDAFIPRVQQDAVPKTVNELDKLDPFVDMGRQCSQDRWEWDT